MSVKTMQAQIKALKDRIEGLHAVNAASMERARMAHAELYRFQSMTPEQFAEWKQADAASRLAERDSVIEFHQRSGSMVTFGT